MTFCPARVDVKYKLFSLRQAYDKRQMLEDVKHTNMYSYGSITNTPSSKTSELQLQNFQ